ncbi:MAG: cytochrome c3 family protein [Phycisphaerales bacterium]
MRRLGTLLRNAMKLRIRRRYVIALVAVFCVVGGVRAWRALRPLRPEPDAAMTVPSDLAQARLAAKKAPKPVDVVTFKDGCITAECHASMNDLPLIHAPVREAACDACHLPDSGGHVFPLAEPKETLCTSCHDTSRHGRFQHKAMSEDGCLACHVPHASKNKALLAAETLEATCVRCHPRSEGRVRHEPYALNRCDDCHDPHGADNQALLLGGEGAALCERCHSPLVHTVEVAEHSHRDVKRSCLACHEPHASDHAGLMVAEPREACVRCHADVERAVATAVVPHDPVVLGQQCVTCHEPHATDRPRMLRDTQAKVCLGCHDKALKSRDGREIPEVASAIATSPVVHGAIRANDCSACHAVHGGDHERLLRAINPNALAGPYDVRNYALCFNCHDRDLAEIGANTGFRNGRTNLHELHLRGGGQTRGCGVCHEIHAGNLPRLIAEKVNFEGSGWQMPIGFKLTPDGGSCAPGCHEPMQYSRRAGEARGPRTGGTP